jgi:hypothetical protein
MFDRGEARRLNSHSPRRSPSFPQYTDMFRINCSAASKIRTSTCFSSSGTGSKTTRSDFANRRNINGGKAFFIIFTTLFPQLNISRSCLRAEAERSSLDHRRVSVVEEITPSRPRREARFSPDAARPGDRLGRRAWPESQRQVRLSATFPAAPR